MASKTDPNAPAAPSHTRETRWSDFVGEVHITVSHPGLTKREWFAGLAMQGLCAYSGLGGTGFTSDKAESAVLAADALIAALNEEASHGE